MRRFLLIIVTFLTAPFLVLAYSENTTHPALTDEIVDFFNFSYPDRKVSDVEKELVKMGSKDEDDLMRPMHHFYDPVYERGIEMIGAKWQSSKNWAEDTLGQAGIVDRQLAGSLKSYFGAKDDHSWERAIYEYVWGDKERGLTDLGHILHLIEDASVPDHTRNDPHPPAFDFGSPYEAWTAQFDSEKLDGFASSLYDLSQKPIVFDNLSSYFNSMAGYSNNNFFSKDTIFHEDYNEPVSGFSKREKLSDGNIYIFQYRTEPNIETFYRLVASSANSEWFGVAKNKKQFFIDDNDNLILSDYWSRLSKQAVLHGAGVMKLFFDEVEKEKKSKLLYEKNRSWLARQIDEAKKKLFGVAGVLYGTSVDEEALAELNADEPLTNSESSDGVAPTAKLLENVGGLSVNKAGSVSDVIKLELEVLDGSKVDVPTASVASVPFSSFDSGGSSPFNTPSIPPAGDIVAVSSTQLSPGPLTGSTTPSIGDATAPSAPTIIIDECVNSLSFDGCLLATTTIAISWLSSASDLVSYTITCVVSDNTCDGFSFSATTATSTVYDLPTDGAIYTFTATARDAAGNESAASIKTVEIFTRPIVINEIAWAGTAASSADEWIELKNRTAQSIDLSGWILRSFTDNKPYILLSGTIAAGSYYLIERTNDATVSDITADLVTTFGSGAGLGLSNSGEILSLEYASTTIDQTILCFSTWCGGVPAGSYPSMERIDPEISGTDTSNWGTANGVVVRGKDSANAMLVATPKSRNSLNYLIAQGSSISAPKTLIASMSPYVIPNNQTFTVDASTTLTVEPGVTIKMGSDAELKILGTISAVGTANDPIIFTSLKDDTYGGDVNGDGTVTSPQAGDWKGIRVDAGSANSIFQYARFRYGGKWYTSTDLSYRSMVSVVDAVATFSNSTFEYSNIAGLRLSNSNSTVTSNTFSIGTTTDNNALYVVGGAPSISQNTFSQNYQGIVFEGVSADVQSNAFTSNILYPIYATNSTSTYQTNSGSGNGKNGIALVGSIVPAGATTTLYQNSLPYLTLSSPYSNATIPVGGGAIVQAGVEIRGDDANSLLQVNGTLKLEGTAKGDILLTSLNDSYVSGAGGWRGIVVGSTGLIYGGGFTLRYGGGATCLVGDPYSANNTCAGLRIDDGGRVALDNIRIEKNYTAGIRIVGATATSTIANAEINDHTLPASNSTGMILIGAAVSLDTISLFNNTLGIYSSGSSISVTTPSSVIFSNNTAVTSPSGLLP